MIAVSERSTVPCATPFPVAPDGIGLDGIVWSVMGAVCIPKEIADARFCWAVTFAEDAFWPARTHAREELCLGVVKGQLDVVVEGELRVAAPGEVLHLPRKTRHGLFNNSGKPVIALQWATPGDRMAELFRRLHNRSIAEAIEIGRLFGVTFAPPVSSAGSPSRT